MTGGPLIDPRALERLRSWGGDDLLERMIEIFQRVGRERLDQLGRAVDHGDLEGMERAAHSLKSSAGNLGAEQLRALARALEGAASSGRGEEARDLAPLLAEAYEQTMLELTRVWSTRASAPPPTKGA